MKKPIKTVGVVVGRFQTPFLHDGHRYLLDTAMKRGRSLLVALGVSRGVACTKNPLSFDIRAKMIHGLYPDAIVVPVIDNPIDEVWSENLDRIIEEKFPGNRVILFGSRDSFIPHYKGKNKCRVVKEKKIVCATDIRERCQCQLVDSEVFRAGVIYARKDGIYPTSFQTVDVVIRHSHENKVVLGRKLDEKGWRFPGGFVDPEDLTLERAAKREVLEEVGDVEIDDIRYIGSIRVDDHRYRKSDHKIMTTLFSAVFQFGKLEARDDLEEVRWQNIDENFIDCLVDAHKPLGLAYLKTIK